MYVGYLVISDRKLDVDDWKSYILNCLLSFKCW